MNGVCVLGAVRQDVSFPPTQRLADVHACVVQVKDFIQSVGKLTWRHCNSLCFNLGRQRRRVIKSVDDWSDLQTTADDLDALFFVVDSPEVPHSPAPPFCAPFFWPVGSSRISHTMLSVKLSSSVFFCFLRSNLPCVTSGCRERLWIRHLGPTSADGCWTRSLSR